MSSVADAILSLRIDGTPFLCVVYGLALVAAALLILRAPTLRWKAISIAAALTGLGLGYLLCWVVGDVLDAMEFSPTPVSRMWVAFLGAAVGLAIVDIVRSRGSRKLIAVACVTVVGVASAAGLNVDSGAFGTVAQALGTQQAAGVTIGHRLPAVRAGAEAVTAATWRAPSDAPSGGRLYSVNIPGTVSHFHARPAEVYLPPAALVKNPPALPVIVAFSGQPGAPSDLFQLGKLGSLLDAYAQQHEGLAPIVVAPDQLGASGRNPMCVDSPLGNAASYVTDDVVSWVRTHLAAEAEPQHWALLGFSEGATCANQFLDGYPQLFGSELSISTELAPWAGRHTVAEAFHGSQSAYAAAAPTALLRAHAPYRNTLAMFVVGARDTRFRPHSENLCAAARAAGVDSSLLISPGSAHDWNTVRFGLRYGLPPVLGHLGLPR